MLFRYHVHYFISGSLFSNPIRFLLIREDKQLTKIEIVSKQAAVFRSTILVYKHFFHWALDQKKKNNFFFTALINCSAILQYIFSALHPFNALILYSVKQAVTLKNLALIVPWKPLYNMKNFTGSAYFCREVFSK